MDLCGLMDEWAYLLVLTVLPDGWSMVALINRPMMVGSHCKQLVHGALMYMQTRQVRQEVVSHHQRDEHKVIQHGLRGRDCGNPKRPRQKILCVSG